jgi:hypothetical protein
LSSSTLIVAVLFQSVWQAVATVVSDVFVTNDPAHPVTEQAQTKFYQFVDTPYTATYSPAGVACVNFLPLASRCIIPVDGYGQVCVEVAGTTRTTNFDLSMGKMTGASLSDRVVDNQRADAKIHCYKINGPEVQLILNGEPSTTDRVQLWMHLRS